MNTPVLYCEPGSKWLSISRTQLERGISGSVPSMILGCRKMISEADDPDKVADEMANISKSEFCWSLCFTPAFLERLFYSGFLSIATDLGDPPDSLYLLLPKLHLKRCILFFEGFHISKKTRKLASRYTLSVNQAFDKVVRACVIHHGMNWLYPPLLAALKALNSSRGNVRSMSVELWSGTTLVAGELGVMVGSVYISLTGFSDRKNHSGAGTVQLAALAELLRASCVAFWDLGMTLEYKLEMGAHEIHRKEFLKLFRSARDSRATLCESHRSARELIDSLMTWQSNR